MLKSKTSNLKKPLFHPPKPLEAAVKKDVFAEKRACLFEHLQSKCEFKPAAQTAFLTGSFGAAKTCAVGSSFFAYFL
ncbi:MAG: hypothetical protein Q4G42_03705 [Neisseria sp.]|nr:hypothetical protein [Neisseria sp.]